MIDVTELRLGNQILANRVTETVTHIKPNLIVFDNTTQVKKTAKPEFINGIKLTPLLLENLGYKDIGGVGVFCFDFENKGRRYEYDLEDIGKGTYDFSCNRYIICEIEYVHELQNLHHLLTGNEIMIEF